MKIQIRSEVHEQLKNLACSNEIAITDLANSLLEKMLNHHHHDLKKIIMEMKQK